MEDQNAALYQAMQTIERITSTMGLGLGAEYTAAMETIKPQPQTPAGNDPGHGWTTQSGMESPASSTPSAPAGTVPSPSTAPSSAALPTPMTEGGPQTVDDGDDEVFIDESGPIPGISPSDASGA